MVRLRSYKLRFVDRRVRVVPATDAAGCPFSGPGVDLVGDDAEPLLALAEPLADALSALEPGIELRALAVDLERPRLTASLAPTSPERDPRPRVVRLDAGPALERLLEAARPLEASLAAAAASKLASRAAR